MPSLNLPRKRGGERVGRDAIEEGFILDVLTNYTTYQGYYEVIKSIKENPKYNNKKAQKKIRQTVERNPKTIQAKAEIMMDHFDTKIFHSHKLDSQAKAMVVCKDIECAILYYQAIKDIIAKNKLPYHALIAFSGEKKLGDKAYTEAGLNGFPETDTATKFDEDDNRILVVANKYLTGFDQPKLCAMYIDKPLAGVLAVQALSRLNRSAAELGKRNEDLFVLDFYNSVDDMKAAFEPFYTATTLSGATDVNVLHELMTTLLTVGVFDMDEVTQFSDLYIQGKEADEWAPVIDTCAHRFNEEIEWEENTYGARRTALNQHIELDSGESTIDPLAPKMVNAGGDDGEKDPLDEIVKQFNEHWFKGWDATPDEQKAKIINLSKMVREDEDYQFVEGNSDPQTSDQMLANIIKKQLLAMRKGDKSLYKEYKNSKAFQYGMLQAVKGFIANRDHIRV